MPDSAPVTFLAAGSYFWQATYSGDANNSAASSVCTSEPITITPNTPTLTTALSASSAAIGSPVTDSATLAGATTNAGGTVTYTVYTDSACTTPATSQISAQPAAVTVTGGVAPPSAPVSFLAAGGYFWQAIYSGDANNTAAASVCTSEPITISPNSPTIATALQQPPRRWRWPTSLIRPPWPEPPPMRGARSPTASIRAVGPRHAWLPTWPTLSPPA